VSWDRSQDGRRRFDVPVTLILDPALALVVWVHFAPPIADMFRVSYRRLLRWNDELPFVKFAIAEDERPVLTAELPVASADCDTLGLAVARTLAICDQLLEESAGWIWLGGRIPDQGDRVSRRSACSRGTPTGSRSSRRRDRPDRRAVLLLALFAAIVSASSRRDPWPPPHPSWGSSPMPATRRSGGRPSPRLRRHPGDQPQEGHGHPALLLRSRLPRRAPGTSDLRVSAEGLKPTVKVSKRTADYDLLLISFGAKVMSGKALDLRLTFDLADAGGEVERDVRIGEALATFPVWAFGSEQTPGGTVEVVFPAGYHVEFAAGSIPGPTKAGDTIVYRTGRLERPLEFFAYVVADREGAHALTPIETRIGDDRALVHVRAWKDDPAFAERVGDLFARGMPHLGEAIGLDYPRREPLTVVESVSRSLGGYAGLFDPTSGRISIDYAANSLVVLHEAAHVWFNGSLLADRWANEGFASLYAARAAGALELPDVPERLVPELEPARVPLNAWARWARPTGNRGLRVRSVSRARRGDRGASRDRHPARCQGRRSGSPIGLPAECSGGRARAGRRGT
jgi:hypothetical protein